VDRGDSAKVIPRLLIGALFITSACRSSTPPGVTEIQLWAMGREGEVVEQMLPGLEREHPDLRVRVQQIPWSAAHEKLLTAYVGGAMPDVFQAGNTWLPELHALGAVEPLDGRIDGSQVVVRDDYFPGILDTNVIDGKTWGLPWYVDTRLLFYRSDLLAEAGEREPPQTWEAWVDAMSRIEAGAGLNRYAILVPLQEWQLPVILAMQRGALLLRDGDRYGDFESSAFRDAFDFYLGLFRRGLAPRSAEAGVANIYQDFARGDFAFYVTGPWNLGEFRDRLPADMQERWATAPMPAALGGYPGVSVAGGASLVVSRGSRVKEAAWRVVEFLSARERQAHFYRLTGDLPARRSAWLEQRLTDDPRTRAFGVQLEAVRPVPKVPEWERIAAVIARHCESAVRGDVDGKAALAALDRDVDAILEKRRWLLARAEAR